METRLQLPVLLLVRTILPYTNRTYTYMHTHVHTFLTNVMQQFSLHNTQDHNVDHVEEQQIFLSNLFVLAIS